MKRSFRPFALALAALAAFAAPSARAVFSPSLFDQLGTELVERRDVDLAGTLTKPQKAQRAAVLACIARIAKPADDVADDCASASFICAKLARPFADEFGVVAKTLAFGPVLTTLVTNLTATVEGDLGPTLARVSDLSGKFGKKAQAAARAAQRALDQANALPSSKLAARASKLAAAARSIAKANAYADKAEPHGTGGVTASIDGDAYTADSAAVEYYQGDDTFHFDATRDIGAGAAELIYVSIRGVTGPGTYPFNGTFGGYYGIRSAAFDYTTWNITSGTGSIVITTFDLANEHVVGTFSFTGTDFVGSNGTRVVSSGTFDIRGGFTIHAGDGFLSKD